MQVKTSELNRPALDWAVAKCIWVDWTFDLCTPEEIVKDCQYSSDWRQGGPIIEREIDTLRKRSKVEESSLANPNPNFKFKAEIYGDIDGYFCGFGSSPLIAAMRCYVASKLGETVDIPEELI